MALKQDLTKIALEKENRKKKQQKLKNQYITTIYKGLVKNKTIREIHKELYDQTINKKSPMLLKAMGMTNRIKKKLSTRTLKDAKAIIGPNESNPLILLSVLIFDEIKKTNLDQELNHEIVIEADKKESDGKLEALENAMASGNVFFLASKHHDCAKDHLIAQGRMFYNKNWMSEIDSDIAKREIANYLDKYKLQTVQYITSKPVWFITRPNCRHYFREIPVKEALQTNVSTLLKRYKMETAIGKRPYLQTLKSGKDRKIIGEIRNAELVIEKYKERLRLFKAMYDVQPNPMLRNAINKTQALIQKWSEYYEKLVNKK